MRQGLLRHLAAVKRTAREGEPNGRNDGEGHDGAGGPPPQRFSAKRKLRAVSRLLRGEPLELVARELNVAAARLSEWRDRALLAAEAALKERERDDRDDEIVRLKGKVGEMTMETGLLREKI
ncbi:MAG TPA: transposase, partial [Candidatus Acidoferrum sp.]|nr:transposase [Candidatus Acidoferrum sp.]